MKYMKAHGNAAGPGQKPGTTGFICGLLGGVPLLLCLNFSGALWTLSRELGIPQILMGVVLIVGAGIAGVLYGRIFNRAANSISGGWLFGLCYGFLLWLVGPTLVLNSVRPRAPIVGTAAMAVMGGYLSFGLILGVTFHYVHGFLQQKKIEP